MHSCSFKIHNKGGMPIECVKGINYYLKAIHHKKINQKGGKSMKNMAKLLTVIMFCLAMVVQAWAEGWYYNENYSYSAIGSDNGIAAMYGYSYNEGGAMNGSGDSYMAMENEINSYVWGGINGYGISESSNYSQQETYVDDECAYTYEYNENLNQLNADGAALAESYASGMSFSEANYGANSVTSYTSIYSGSYIANGVQSTAWTYNDNASISETEVGSDYAYGGIVMNSVSGSFVMGDGVAASSVMANGGIFYQSN